MSSYSADWLALREPYDARARNIAVCDAVVAAFADRPSITIVDLACGTGATLRALAPRFAAQQNWRLVDNDLGLLARAADGVQPRARITTVPIDLARDLEAALDGSVDLVATSALLDLVSEQWLERLAVEVAARRISIYAALSYDGRIALDPSDAFDDRIIGAVNSHQRRDKGFGPALGPAAVASAIARFESLGYAVVHGDADWVAGADDREFQMEMLSGWATAAREIGDLPLVDIVGWLTRRRDAVAARRSSIRVGHRDFFARPLGRRWADRSQSNSTSSSSRWTRMGARKA